MDTSFQGLHGVIEAQHALNDALHSVNDALHSVNDALHSVRDALHSVRDALRSVGEALHRDGDTLDSVDDVLDDLGAALHGALEASGRFGDGDMSPSGVVHAGVATVLAPAEAQRAGSDDVVAHDEAAHRTKGALHEAPDDELNAPHRRGDRDDHVRRSWGSSGAERVVVANAVKGLGVGVGVRAVHGVIGWRRRAPPLKLSDTTRLLDPASPPRSARRVGGVIPFKVSSPRSAPSSPLPRALLPSPLAKGEGLRGLKRRG